MSSRKRQSMRLEEVGLRITEDAVLAHNAAGEIVGEYVRHKTPLQLWRRNGLRQAEYEAGLRYGQLWREVCQPRSPAHSDTTRIIVDGGGAAPDPSMAQSSDELRHAQREIGDEETVTFLNRLCGMEDWPADKRRFKRKCRRGLEVLAALWLRR